MPLDDLKEHARSGQDFYGLLSINQAASEAEVRRAYRKVALKYHPDKNPGNASAIEKFHLLQIANDVLSDAEARAIYDAGRKAKFEKEERERAYSAKRREFIDALERGEKAEHVRGVGPEKRPKASVGNVREEAARRMTEKRRRDGQEAEVKEDGERVNGFEPGTGTGGTVDESPGTQGAKEVRYPEASTVEEEDRTVKVTWRREGSGEKAGKELLETAFSSFGKIFHIMVCKDKRKRLADGQEKSVIGSAFVAFDSLASAYAAVEESDKIRQGGLETFESVSWMRGAAPAVIANLEAGQSDSSGLNVLSKDDATRIRLRAASKRQKILQQAARRATAETKVDEAEVVDTLGRAPPPKVSSIPKKYGVSANGHSAKRSRLRVEDAERRRLEEEIRRQDEAEDEGME